MGAGTVEAQEDDGGPHAQQIQIYGTSEMSIGFEGGSFRGIIYAPSNDFEENTLDVGSAHCEQQACFHSNPEFTGAFILSSVNFQGGSNNDFTYDYALNDVNIDPYPDGYTPPPQLTYMNVAHHTVDVTNR